MNKSMTCSAPSGWYCSPQNRLMVCPESFYCAGGTSFAVQCPDQKWSAPQSITIDACYEQTHLVLWVVMGIVVIVILAACLYTPRSRNNDEYSLPPQQACWGPPPGCVYAVAPGGVFNA